ncbi:hypothetical protein ACH5RR_028333 [Cinchona calisaya]|uniref:Myb-like domain-containing protein n=1 Tax=Cinchona calisaya TaxID=153742 RepID=A0ABD2YNG9_9GENT
MGWSEKDFCIKCDKGGKLLVCSDSRCPIAVHETCMGFPAKFDEMGKFYCPYCVYRQAVEESNQAREQALYRKKALSIFLDARMINGNGDRRTQETGISEGRESAQLLGIEKANTTHSWNDENRLDKVDIHSHPARLVEAPGCSRRVLLRNETDVSLLGNQNYVFCSKYGDISGPSDCNHRFVVVGHRTESGPIVACGNEYASSEEEETTKQFEIVEIGNKDQLQPQWKHDDVQPGGIVEDHLDDNNSSDSRVIEKQGIEHGFSAKTKYVGYDADTFEEYEGGIGGQEVMEKVQESPAFPASEPALQVHLKEKIAIQTSDSICPDSKSTLTGRHAKRNVETKDQCIEANCLRRSSRNSVSVPRADADQFEKVHVSSKSIKITKPAPEIPIILFPNARRKSLPWTDAEEEMLKEGVQKFLTTINKNIPWRKILEFGRHVFDGSRTPVDLKDKWRNMLPKYFWLRIKFGWKSFQLPNASQHINNRKITCFSKCARASLCAGWKILNLKATGIDCFLVLIA